jgi:hypothetical protein
MKIPKINRYLVACGLGVAGAGLVAYAQALAAFLITPCRSLQPPFQSFRCASPMIFLWLGYALLGIVVIVLTLPWLRRVWPKAQARRQIARRNVEPP